MKKDTLILIACIISACWQCLNAQSVNDIYRCSDVEASQAYIEGNVYQKDFLLFMNMLKQTHPAFVSALQEPFDIDSLMAERYEDITNCPSTDKLMSHIQQIVSLLQDSHTTTIPDINKSLIYPFNCYVDGHNMYIRGIDKQFNICLGKKIVKINGNSVCDVLESFKSIMSYDNENHFLDKVFNYMQLYSLWENNPYSSQDSSLMLVFEDGTNVALKPVASNKLNIDWIRSAENKDQIRERGKQPFLYKILNDRSFCYMQFNSCVDQGVLYSQYYNQNNREPSGEMLNKILMYPKFDEFLHKMFQDIKENDIRTLVIDVRSNSGGNSRLCDMLLSWLKPWSEINNGTTFIRPSQLWKQQYPELFMEYEKFFHDKKMTISMDSLYDALSIITPIADRPDEKDNYFVLNEDKGQIFKGNVIFIQDKKTYSSAGLLVTRAIDNNIGIVIGDDSSYRPCSCGDILFWRLPNTGIRGTVSHQVFNRPDHLKCNQPSLFPDEYISLSWSDLLEGNDACWQWIKTHN